MKPSGFVGLCFTVAIVSICGCASNPSRSTAVNSDPGKQRKGHWETRPAETGSLTLRRVWVDESGREEPAPPTGNVQIGSGSALQNAQRSQNGKPIGQ
jgi:hypothetical protein